MFIVKDIVASSDRMQASPVVQFVRFGIKVFVVVIGMLELPVWEEMHVVSFKCI